MKLRHLVGTLVLALTMGTALPAHAQYPPTVGNGRVTRSEVKQCQCTLFSGDGFLPGTTVTVTDRGPTGAPKVVATVTADSKGGFKVKVCFDEKSVPGKHTLAAKGTGADGKPREVRATVTVDGSVCFGKGDEVHNPNAAGEDDQEEGREGSGSGSGTGAGSGSGGSGTGSGPAVDGVGLPRTGAGYVLPGLLFGFLLVVTGSAVVHLTRRRRLLPG